MSEEMVVSADTFLEITAKLAGTKVTSDGRLRIEAIKEAIALTNRDLLKLSRFVSDSDQKLSLVGGIALAAIGSGVCVTMSAQQAFDDGDVSLAINKLLVGQRLATVAACRLLGIEIDAKEKAHQTLQNARHAEMRKAKSEVLAQWEANPSQWPSAAKAGKHFAAYLFGKEITVESDTVTGWIRRHAKQKGIRL